MALDDTFGDLDKLPSFRARVLAEHLRRASRRRPPRPLATRRIWLTGARSPTTAIRFRRAALAHCRRERDHPGQEDDRRLADPAVDARSR
jgi:hypothetical protein